MVLNDFKSNSQNTTKSFIFLIFKNPDCKDDLIKAFTSMPTDAVHDDNEVHFPKDSVIKVAS